MSFWPSSLVREIAERRVIFFIGAGLSKVAYNSFPRWSELLTELTYLLLKQKDKSLVRKLIKQGGMLDAAQILRDGASKADFNAKLREIFQIRPTPHHKIYEDLLSMDPKTIVTTNYDELLEKNFEYYSGGAEAHSISKHKSEHLLNDLRSPIRSIIKLHGCISEPSDLVLDRLSYFNARRKNPGLFNTVSSLMTVNTVLFLGYSLSDPDIQLTLENINLFNRSENPHYALMSKFNHPAIRAANTHTYNVDFLEYPSGAHDKIPFLVSELREEVLKLRGARGIV